MQVDSERSTETGHLTSGFVQASGAVPAQRMDPAATAAAAAAAAAGAVPAQRMDPAATAADAPCPAGTLPMRIPAASTQGTDSTAAAPAAAAGDASHRKVSAPPATDAAAKTTTTAAAGGSTTPADQPLMQSVAEVSASRWRAGKAYALGQEARRRLAQHQTLPERLLAQVAHPPFKPSNRRATIQQRSAAAFQAAAATAQAAHTLLTSLDTSQMATGGTHSSPCRMIGGPSGDAAPSYPHAARLQQAAQQLDSILERYHATQQTALCHFPTTVSSSTGVSTNIGTSNNSSKSVGGGKAAAGGSGDMSVNQHLNAQHEAAAAALRGLYQQVVAAQRACAQLMPADHVT